MFDALKKTGVKTSDVDFVLASLLAKHEAVGARAQLKTLWIGYVRAVLQEDEEAPMASGAGGGPRWGRWGGCVRARTQTPPESMQLPAQQPETSHVYVVVADSIGCRTWPNGPGRLGLICVPAANWQIARNTLEQNNECHSTAQGTQADQVLYLFSEATIRAKAAFRFNQSIITHCHG